MIRSQALLLTGLLLITVLIASCSTPSQTVTIIPTAERKLNYIGEISGRFGEENLNLPVSISFDIAENAYIIDQGNNRVVKLNPDHSLSRENGGYGLGINGLNHPATIESDGGVSFFILDQGNNRLVRSDYNLVFSDEIRFVSHPDLQYAGKIADIAFSRFGNLYLVDQDNLKVIMLDKDYTMEHELFPPGGFLRCTIVTAGEDGNTYVYDREMDMIYTFDSFGNPNGTIDLEDSGILGDFVVSRDMIIASDKERHELVLYDHEGNRILGTGNYGSGTLNFSGPTGLAMRGDNRIYVCDTGNNRIVIYELAAPLP